MENSVKNTGAIINNEEIGYLYDTEKFTDEENEALKEAAKVVDALVGGETHAAERGWIIQDAKGIWRVSPSTPPIIKAVLSAIGAQDIRYDVSGLVDDMVNLTVLEKSYLDSQMLIGASSDWGAYICAYADTIEVRGLPFPVPEEILRHYSFFLDEFFNLFERGEAVQREMWNDGRVDYEADDTSSEMPSAKVWYVDGDTIKSGEVILADEYRIWVRRENGEKERILLGDRRVFHSFKEVCNAWRSTTFTVGQDVCYLEWDVCTHDVLYARVVETPAERTDGMFLLDDGSLKAAQDLFLPTDEDDEDQRIKEANEEVLNP